MKAQIVVLAFWAGALLYVYAPTLRGWWERRPQVRLVVRRREPLAPYSRYQDVKL